MYSACPCHDLWHNLNDLDTPPRFRSRILSPTLCKEVKLQDRQTISAWQSHGRGNLNRTYTIDYVTEKIHNMVHACVHSLAAVTTAVNQTQVVVEVTTTTDA